MNIELQIQGPDADQDSIFALQDWLNSSDIKGLQVEQKKFPPSKDAMGADVISILTLILSSGAIIELMRTLHTWVKQRRQDLKIKIKVNDTTVEIDGRNLMNETTITAETEKLLKAAKNS